MTRRIRTKIFPPHSESQAIIMHHLAAPNPVTREIWVACGTKYGKSLSASAAICYAAPRRPGTLWRWLAPIAKQTKIGKRYIKNIWPGPPYTKELKAENAILIPDLDIELQFWHGQNPEDLEGEAVVGQVNDECAKLKEQCYTSSRTTWTMTRAQRLNISTPRGRNWFWKGCMRAKEEMERAAHENRQPREIFLTAPTRANPFVPQESIDEAKKLLPARLFNQYYLAEFIDDGDVFPKIKIDRDFWKEPFEKSGSTEVWIAPDHGKRTIVAGCDWAKTQDYTVLTCWDTSDRPFRCVGFIRMQGRKYPQQLLMIARFINKFLACDVLFHDKTGIGNVIDDLLEEIPGLVYHGVTFTNSSKAEMVNSMINAIELDEILFPWWSDLEKEFDAYEVTTNALGRMTYQAAEGFHDDIVTSCFLGYAAAKEYSGKDYQIKFLEELSKEKMPKSAFEQYYSNDDDDDF